MRQFNIQEGSDGGLLIRDWRNIDTNTHYLLPDEAEQFRKDMAKADPAAIDSLCAEYFD